jgi:hypothetical protein
MLATLALGSGAAHAAGPTVCSGTMNSVSLHSNVRVPSGKTCVLVESSVVGNVVVDPGGTLITQGSNITGNVQSNYGAVSLGPDQTAGPTSVSGNVQTVGGGPVTLLSTKVGGNTSISHEPSGSSPNTICASTIGGNLMVRGNYTQSVIGDPSACGSGAGNDITGNFWVLYNTASGSPAAVVSSNTVGGNLRCRHNRGPVFSLAGSNVVSGKSVGECAASAGGTETACTPTAPAGGCSGSGRSADGSAALTVTTANPSSGTEHIFITFGPPPIGCTTAHTGAVATFYVTNPGPGEKTVVYDSLGAAADAAQAAHPIESTEGSSFGYACYESPAPFTTFSGAPAATGPDGYYGQLPSCQAGKPPCVQAAAFIYGERPTENDYRTVITTTQADPRLSH